MKIALVHYSAAPVIGGVERILDEHARLFVANGHDVTIFCQRGGIEPDEVPASRPRHYWRCERLSGSPAASEFTGEFDIIFAHNVLTMPFCIPFTEALWRLASERPETRVVAWTHDVAAANPDLAPVPELLRRAPDGVEFVAVSELRRRQLCEFVGVRNCRVIPNGLEPSKVLGLAPAVADFAEKFRLFDGRRIFLHPTRLLRRKNVELGIEIVRALGDSILIVTGAEDPHNDASKQYATQLRELTGGETLFAADYFAVGDSELASLYRLADALIFPSRQEGFGLPMIEARLHRLPVIHSAIEPLSELAGEHAFSISLAESPAENAVRLRAWMDTNPAVQDRSAVLREFSWDAIYRKHLVPLLDGAENSADK